MPVNVPLRRSTLLDAVPELTAPDRDPVYLNPGSFESWSKAFEQWPDADDYVLAPGDYRRWGQCQLSAAGTQIRRRSIRFIDSPQKAWDRIPHEAIVGGFDFQPGAAFWLVHGLTLRGPGPATAIVRNDAHHVIFDSMLIEDFLSNGVRFFGNNCIVQNSVIRRLSPDQDPDHGAREVTVERNIISSMGQYNALDPGAVLRTYHPFVLRENQFSHCHTLSSHAKAPNEHDDFAGNTLHDVPLGEADLDWTATNHVVEAEKMVDLQVERRRWTTRDRAHLHTAILDPHPPSPPAA
jgi:hypothetical protein